MFGLTAPVPCLNNEPYYDGLKWGNTADQGSDLAAYYSRVALYGSVLSGGLAGHVYGAHHTWSGDPEMPDAFLVQSAPQMQHIREFLLAGGKAYQDLVPDRGLLDPSQTPNEDGRKGWAYCMRTETWDLFLLYFEMDCPRPNLTGATPGGAYEVQWFDTVTGAWAAAEPVKADASGGISMPEFPCGQGSSQRDWAARVGARG